MEHVEMIQLCPVEIWCNVPFFPARKPCEGAHVMLSVLPQRWLQMESRSAIWNMLIVHIYIYVYIYIAKLIFDSAYFFCTICIYIYIYTYYLAICLCHWKIPEMMQLFRWRISQSKKNHHYVNPDCPSERNASSPNLACSSWAANLWIYGVYGYQFELVNTNWGHSISMRWLPD